MVIKRYYPNNEALNKCEEPYRSVVELLDKLYVEVLEGCETIESSSFPPIYVISAVRTIYEQLKENHLTFNHTLLHICAILKARYNSMQYDQFFVATPSCYSALWGAVYYVVTLDLYFSDEHLELMEKVLRSDNLSTAIFQYFKKPADQKRKELIANNISGQVREKPLPPSKRIVLTNQSETARVVKAMAMSGHFKHEDGSRVSEAEVGRKFCSSFGIKSSWDSLIQSAFKMEGGVAGTFDALKDKAVKHYRKVNKICD